MVYVKVFIFNSKDIEGHGRRNREGLEYALWHTFKPIKREDNQVFIHRIASVSKLGQWLRASAFIVSLGLC